MKDTLSVILEKGFPIEEVQKLLDQGLCLDEIANAVNKVHERGESFDSDHNQKLVSEALITKTVRRNGVDVVEVCCTSENFKTIFDLDGHFSNIRFNTMRQYPERVINGRREQWTDSDDSEARSYIESQYGIYNRQKADDGFSAMLRDRKYNPVQEAIKAIEWDGVPRCETFLTKWMGAEDNAYTRECSRLLFAGGINRAFNPGCKFDCVIVLIGSQGGGKSTLCRWLAMDGDFYTSTKTINGQKGLESIQGKWIVEIEELLAVLANERTGQKQEEAAKAFLSGQSDFYRKPYDRRAQDVKRSCIFIGTTNRETFLTDKTGNRRWFPVRCRSSAAHLYNHAAEVKADIAQAWAEMLAAYQAGDDLSRPVEKIDLMESIKAEQTSAEVEDWRVGVIGEYIKDKPRVCLIEIWCEALNPNSFTPPKMTRKDSNEIAEILVHSFGATRGNPTTFGPKYGQQKAFYLPDNQRDYEILP